MKPQIYLKLLIVILLSVICLPRASAKVPDLKRAKDYNAKIPVRVVKKIPLPRGWHEGLLYDGKNIWVNNGEGFDTWIIDPETGAVVDKITPVAGFSEGITSYGDGTFWVTDWDSKKLYRVRVEEGKMVSEYDISLAPSRPTGVVWTGERLYVITWTRGGGTSYHLMPLDDDGEHLSRKMRIRRIHEPSQLAWDGRHLWITSWYSRRVYKIDVDTFKVLGSFKSPAPETTGIVWDGRYFWITGTHVGLYQVELEE